MDSGWIDFQAKLTRSHQAAVELLVFLRDHGHDYDTFDNEDELLQHCERAAEIISRDLSTLQALAPAVHGYLTADTNVADQYRQLQYWWHQIRPAFIYENGEWYLKPPAMLKITGTSPL